MDTLSTIPQQVGVSFDHDSLLFFACLIAALGLVYLFCSQKFDERSITGNDDYVYQLLPRQLATRREYSKGFLIYFGSMALTVLLLSLIGPRNLEALGIPLSAQVGNVVVPLAIAFLLVGVMPTVPGLMAIETFLRRYAHERAYIPSAALATAERLAAADFDFSSYQGEALESPEMRGVEVADFTRSRRSLEHDWARLSCLVYEQKSRRTSGLVEPLDAGLLRDYEKDLELIEDKRRSMEAEIAAYRAEKAKNPSYTSEALRRVIRGNLYKLYVLLGCAVRINRQSHHDVDLALRPFGFMLTQAPSERDNNDLKVVGITVVAASILLLGLAAAGLGHLELWTLSPVFPRDFFQPFIDTISTLIPYLTAIVVADLLRKRAIRKGRWFASNGHKRRAIGANYIRVAAICGLVGYVGLVLWGFVLAPPTLAGLKVDAPNALIAMVTGGFYVYHLDNVEMNTRPSRIWEVGPQALLTGVCGLIAASVSWEIIFGAAGSATDRILLTVIISATVGFVLAWYIPDAAAAAKADPLTEAREERIRTLEAAALERFGNAAAAAHWLDRPHGGLGNKSPKTAAANVETFEQAINLLQGPQAVVA
jgi:uncharacterized protein (DUF2384 family)